MWTGFYVGGSVGYGAGGWNASSNQRVFNFESTTADPNVKGVTAGIQAGYNWRFAPKWVIGIEAEIVDPLKAGQVWNDPGLTGASIAIPGGLRAALRRTRLAVARMEAAVVQHRAGPPRT